MMSETKVDDAHLKSVTDGQNSPVPPSYHPTSEYQEYVEIPGLTLYDIHRKPREVLRGRNEKDDDTSGDNDAPLMLKLHLNNMKSEFHCPICLSFMVKTTIVMECLHRFCAECIEKCLRSGMKECPSCRVHIPSRRNMRRDVNYDKLIASLFGDLDKLEEMEEQHVNSINIEFMNNSCTDSRKRGIEQQERLRQKKKKNDKNHSEANITSEVS